jgi:cytochrome c553
MMAVTAAARANSRHWRIWAGLTGMLVIAFMLGFVVMARTTADPRVGIWGAICRGIGLTPDYGPRGTADPVAVVPSFIAWTPATLAVIASGNSGRGEFVALNCTVCHGAQGISTTADVPTLAGMDSAALYKQLADYRSGKRDWGVMNGIALALTAQGLTDVAAYYAAQPRGLPYLTGRNAPFAGRSLRSPDPAIRLVFSGDPSRGIAPCGSCHGPSGYKLGAPALAFQKSAYLARETAAFAQGSRGNDINEQMRMIAVALTDAESEALAEFYARGASSGN